MGVLGVQGVGGDHHAGQIQSGRQGRERGNLALGLDLPLSQDDLGDMAGSGQQVNRGAVWVRLPRRVLPSTARR
ncbi:hypothetical protein AB0J35_60310 [Nonomuraea angiospora]|uniref:hypothetical protein n=1 Tax=Nonomuraea angiospora TaxID=46172 RepID=UPI003442784D